MLKPQENGTMMTTINDLLQDFMHDRPHEIATQDHALIARVADRYILDRYSETVGKVTAARSLELPVEPKDEQLMRELQTWIGRGSELASLIVPNPAQQTSSDPAQMSMSEYSRWRQSQEFSRGQGIFDAYRG